MQIFNRTRTIAFGIAGLALFSLAQALTTTAPADASTEHAPLAPEKVHRATALEILSRLDDHYVQLDLDDALSSRLLDSYLEMLDPNRLYFLAEDVKGFEKLRKKLDNQLAKGDLSAGYDIFNLYHRRAHERLAHMLGLINGGITNLDLTDDEEILLTREAAPWPTNPEAANELWRKRLEDAVIAMRIDGDSDDSIQSQLEKRYNAQLARLEQSTAEDVFQGYINALAMAYDPHTTYLTPHRSENFRISMSGTLEGIGAVLQAEDEYTKVLRLVPGGPAAKAGQLRPADRIIGVAQGDGEMVDIIGWRLDEVVNLIRGPKGTTVRLQVLPAAGTGQGARTIDIVRNEVTLEDTYAKSEIIEVEGDNGTRRIGIIDLPTFYIDFDKYHQGDPDYASTTRDVSRLLISMQKEGIDGLVLDLRDNGGGALQEATQLVSMFINRGPTVQVRGANGAVSIQPDHFPGTLYNGPMAVLVNRYSASASEIFAGAMQDYGRALIVGDQTFGKGTVQSLVNLDHGRLKITQAKFYRVSGGSNQHKGIIPDLVMPFVVNKDEIGESAYPNALPWDQIKAARYQPMADLAPYVETVRERHDVRVADDPEFDYVRERIALLDEQLNRTTLSLNEKTRRADLAALQQRQLALENTLRKHRGETLYKTADQMRSAEEARFEALQAGESPEEPDPYLLETGHILSDLISLMSGQELVAIQPSQQ